MVSARSYFARMNENRGDTNWLTDDQLLRGTEKFFKLNGYFNLEYNTALDQLITEGELFHHQSWHLEKQNMMKMMRKK
jgi:hypothetical protein